MKHKRLLIITQSIDTHDPVLGFFHQWVAKLAPHYTSITVLCLKKGAFTLPHHVRVVSLGKEESVSRLVYLYRFFKEICRYKAYDSVFVHMNEEYVLLGGVLWRLFGKHVTLWRNHKQGTWRTRLAVLLVHKVFFTSFSSYTARFKKGVQMPVGVDTEHVLPVSVERVPQSIVYLGRISPIKNIECLIDAVKILSERGIVYCLDIYGPEIDPVYSAFLQDRITRYGIAKNVSFCGVVTPERVSDVYSKYAVCVNMTPSGSFDKTIFESVLCRVFPVVANTSIEIYISSEFRSYVLFDGQSPQSLADTLEKVFVLDEQQRRHVIDTLIQVIKQQHSLDTLVTKLIQIL
jgi:glycosyltransferase involved in cell wall biosynthesis